MMQRLLFMVCDKTEAVGDGSTPSDNSAHAQSSYKYSIAVVALNIGIRIFPGCNLRTTTRTG